MKKLTLSAILIAAFLLAACASPAAPADTGPAVSTAVAMTVAAQKPAATATPCPRFSSQTGQPLVGEGDAGCFYYEPPAGQPPVLGSPTATNAPRLNPTQPAGTNPCEDGKLVLVYNAPVGTVLDRTPVGEAERADIMEFSKEPGRGFGNHDRAIVVIPRLGPVWMVDVKKGADTIMTRGFCGTNEAVTDWAIKAHIPSLQQASRDANGDQPPANEIGVYRLDFEARALIVVKAATADNAPSPEEILSWIEVMFNDGTSISDVQMHVVYP